MRCCLKEEQNGCKECLWINMNSDAQTIPKNKKIRKELIRFLINIISFLLILFIIFRFIFALNIAKGVDMYPAIKDGDILFSYRLQKSYGKGDVVMYKTDGELRCGRIVAIGGDTINIKANGEFSVNNVVQSEEIVFPTYPKDGEEINFQLDDDTYYILGDYRTESNDSRVFGSISEEKIQAKVISIFRRRGI